MRRDTIKVDALLRQGVEFTIVGLCIDTPKPRAADVGQAWIESIARQPEQAEYGCF